MSDFYTVKREDLSNLANELRDVSKQSNELIWPGDFSGAISKVPSTIIISPNSGDISVALNEAIGDKVPGKIIINLNKDGEYTLSESIVISDSLIINGHGATITLQSLTDPLIALKPVENPVDITTIDYLIINDLNIIGLDSPLFYSGCKNYLINNFTLNNCIVNVNANITVFDFTKGSAAKNLNIVNSTLYAIPATSLPMYSSQAGQKITELDPDAIQSFSLENSTIVDFAVNKNFFSHRQSNQGWMSYTAKNCIFIDCGKKGQTIRGMNGGQAGANPTWEIDGNAFQFYEDGVLVDSSTGESTGDTNEPIINSFNGVIEFLKPTEVGNFTQASTEAGDPRWIAKVEGYNPNYIETIEGYAINPFGEMTDSDLAELRAAINSNLATVSLYVDGSSIGMPAGTMTTGPRTDTDQAPYRFWFNAVTNMGESINDFQVMAILYDKSEGTFGILSARVANGGSVTNLTNYAYRIPTTLTIIHHPMTGTLIPAESEIFGGNA